jgi:two-component system phosphate regulon response regulator PhoB
MSKKRLLLVEDETDMAGLVATRLRKEGHEVTIVGDGAAALDRVRTDPPDLAIVDIMLPHMSGTDLVAEMRQDPRTAGIPVIMLTAKAEESDIVVGLSLGADDYITKPFSLSVLVARVAAVLRRAAVARSGKGPVHLGTLVIDVERHLVQVDGHTVTLTLTEFRLLAALVAARGRVLTRNQLIDQAIGLNTIVTDRTIDVHLTSLRRKLGAARQMVRTVRGIGHRLAEDGETTDES